MSPQSDNLKTLASQVNEDMGDRFNGQALITDILKTALKRSSLLRAAHEESISNYGEEIPEIEEAIDGDQSS